MNSFSFRSSWADVIDNLISEDSWGFEFKAEKSSEIFSLITYDNNLREDRQNSIYLIFDKNWGYVLATCCDNKLLDSSCDGQISIAINFPDISWM